MFSLVSSSKMGQQGRPPCRAPMGTGRHTARAQKTLLILMTFNLVFCVEISVGSHAVVKNSAERPCVRSTWSLLMTTSYTAVVSITARKPVAIEAGHGAFPPAQGATLLSCPRPSLPLGTTDMSPHSITLSHQECHIHGIVRCVNFGFFSPFHGWVALYGVHSRSWFKHPAVEGHLGCSPVLAIMNRAATNISVQISV